MSNDKIIRAWKDAEYRNSLSAAERAQMPANPAGLMELTDEDLASANGGTGLFCFATIRLCPIIIRYTITKCPDIHTFLFFC